MHKWTGIGLALIITGSTALSVAPTPAWAQDSCEVAEPLSAQRLLRRLSVDLRDRTPAYAEILAQQGRDEVPEATVDSYLRSEEFTGVMRRYHASLLWPNVSQIEIVPNTHEIYPYEIGPDLPIYMSPLRAAFVRSTGDNLFLPCKAEPAEFDPEGNLITEPVLVGNSTVAWVEGYVEVSPYWAPEETIRVCGFDAIGATVAPACPGPVERYPFLDPICDQIQAFSDAVGAPFRGTMVSCDGPLAIFAPGCGCGEGLRHCQSPESSAAIKEALVYQQLRIVDRVIRSGEPYERILQMKEVEVNGPLAHYLRYQAGLTLDLFTALAGSIPLPEIDYADEAWVSVTRTGRHAGVLTTPGYLLRFTTDRGRAHRYYNAFECSALIPNGPLPSPFDPCSQHEDLTKRCGCDACHLLLEPMASHWGRFAEYGFGVLDDQSFPQRGGGICTPPLESVTQLFNCYRQYELDPIGEEVPFFGMLNAYVFRTGEDIEAIEAGPARLVGKSIESGRLTDCTVRKMWTHFMRREPTLDEEATILPELAQRFDDSGRRVDALVKAIVTLPAYRRAR